jgi:NAD(P)-dependent dehydrogenase (short-subunit alcohol dehydrogenase family)
VIDFSGQAVVVTGAGRGLGRLYALDLARRGASVVVNDIGGSMSGSGADPSLADAVVEELRAAGGSALASHDSVDTHEGASAVIDAATATFGRLDAVISNAGIYEMVPYDELSVDQWRRMLSVHLDGAFYLSQPAYRVMKAQGYGRLVFVASNIAAFGQEHATHYAAAKGGIIGLTNALANEGAPHGIRVNAVLPVGRTRMMLDSMGQREPNPVVDKLFEACTPERVVPLVTYLASSACVLTHHEISAVAGRFARVFMGLGEGWLADSGSDPTAEDIEAHLAEIVATQPSSTPMAVADEIVEMLQRLGII